MKAFQAGETVSKCNVACTCPCLLYMAIYEDRGEETMSEHDVLSPAPVHYAMDLACSLIFFKLGREVLV